MILKTLQKKKLKNTIKCFMEDIAWVEGLIDINTKDQRSLEDKEINGVNLTENETKNNSTIETTNLRPISKQQDCNDRLPVTKPLKDQESSEDNTPVVPDNSPVDKLQRTEKINSRKQASSDNEESGENQKKVPTTKTKPACGTENNNTVETYLSPFSNNQDCNDRLTKPLEDQESSEDNTPVVPDNSPVDKLKLQCTENGQESCEDTTPKSTENVNSGNHPSSDYVVSSESELSVTELDQPPKKQTRKAQTTIRAILTNDETRDRKLKSSHSLSHTSQKYDSSDDLFSSGSEYLPSESVDSNYVSNSCNSDSDVSETFPMLSSNNILKNTNEPSTSKSNSFQSYLRAPSHYARETEESDSDDDLDKETIRRSEDKPNIYVAKIMKNDTTKTGKRKKGDRVYNSYQYCSLCKVKVSNFSQHIMRNQKLPCHNNSTDVQRIIQEKDPNCSNKLKILLRGKFNHEFNMKTLQKGKGELLLERRPVSSFRVEDYGPCPGCFLWISKTLLRYHQDSCAAKSETIKSTSSLVTQSDVICGRIQPIASKLLIKEVYSTMKLDIIGKTARSDALIVQLGNAWMEKNVGNKLMRGTYTSQIMRLCARLLINLQEIQPLEEEQTLWNYLKPAYFDTIVQATLMTASILSEDNLEKPSNARKLGFDIKKIINGKIGLSILNSDLDSRREAEDLLRAIEIYWGTRVAKLASVLLEQRKYNKRTKLPNPEDICKLNQSLQDTIPSLDLDTTNCSYGNFLLVAESVSAKLVLYNRRRSGELQAISLNDYKNRKKGEAPEHLVGDLTMFEVKLLETQEVMTVGGKTGRGVPIILPKVTQRAMEYLTNLEVRKKCGIKSTNGYVFASKGDGVVRAYDALVKACNTAQLQEPELVTSTNLRKYMATVTQVLDLKPNEMEWVLNHLGHTMDVHKVHYRATSDILERTQIAKLLLMQDHNKVAAFKNKPLQDIQIEDIVFGAENGEMDNEVFEKDLLDIDKESDVEEPKQSKRTGGASNSQVQMD